MNRHSALVLHAHVPWVRHPESDRCLEEDWLFESIAECYLPLLEMGHRLRDEKVPWRLTLNLSPTLIGMLNDSLMRERASAYLERTLKLAASEGRATNDPNYRRVAEWYEERLVDLYRDLLGGSSAPRRTTPVIEVVSAPAPAASGAGSDGG